MAQSRRPRKQYNPRKLVVKNKRPTLDESFRIFDPVRSSIEALRGEVETIKGFPVFVDWQGQYSRIDEALLGWVECWERLAPRMDQTALRKLYKKLEAGAPIFEEELTASLEVIDRQQQAFPFLRVEDVKDKVNTELIAIELDRAGIRPVESVTGQSFN